MHKDDGYGVWIRREQRHKVNTHFSVNRILHSGPEVRKRIDPFLVRSPMKLVQPDVFGVQEPFSGHAKIALAVFPRLRPNLGQAQECLELVQITLSDAKGEGRRLP